MSSVVFSGIVVYEGRFWHGKLENEHILFVDRSKLLLVVSPLWIKSEDLSPWTFFARRDWNWFGVSPMPSTHYSFPSYCSCCKLNLSFWWYFAYGSLSTCAVMQPLPLCCSRCESLFLSVPYNVLVTETAPCSKDVDIYAFPCMIFLFGNCSLMG
jgi:hypothetical protein